ncbi:RNA polymerase sigma-70 factor, ECF subfamily [Arenibacter nanhaiticus]|uniref:RNA polymerase sigma-70 factor, ECF subfamily n=1 Tax=Arenibacter nanhaiticus TaxID=558155 RepID=A0A1M6CAR5_9FLAO|nr:RNA polymerase sigma-70 factor [Arenibacter nanhaiticus]SHI58099.1 RNA polymerase sigma-70 factor, ECF subfamily [Arenibacter nanhaiticus]
MSSRDLMLLEKLKGGDDTAFKEIFNLYYMPLCVYSLKYCDSFQIAEDVVQELFVKLWDEKIYMKFEGAMAPYLFKAIKNNTFQLMKRRLKYQFEEIDHHVSVLMEEDNLDTSSFEENKMKLYKEIEALPEKSKEVFKAIVLQNMKYKETAEYLGVSVNTVKTHYSRALKQLRGSLDVIIMLLLV